MSKQVKLAQAPAEAELGPAQPQLVYDSFDVDFLIWLNFGVILLGAEVAIFPIDTTTQPPTHHPNKFEFDLKQQYLVYMNRPQNSLGP